MALDDVQRIDCYYYAFRNEAYLCRQEGIKGILYYIAKRGRDFLRILLHSKPKLVRFKPLLHGMWAGLLFRPEVEFLQPDKGRLK